MGLRAECRSSATSRPTRMEHGRASEGMKIEHSPHWSRPRHGDRPKTTGNYVCRAVFELPGGFAKARAVIATLRADVLNRPNDVVQRASDGSTTSRMSDLRALVDGNADRLQEAHAQQDVATNRRLDGAAGRRPRSSS